MVSYICSSYLFLLQLDGRVKTLHPNVHGGILARRDKKHHMEALDKHGIGEYCCRRHSFILLRFVKIL